MSISIVDLEFTVELLNADASVRENRVTRKTSTYLLKLSSVSTGFTFEAWGVDLLHVRILFEGNVEQWVLANKDSTLRVWKRGESSVVFQLESEGGKASWGPFINVKVEAPISCFDKAQKQFFNLLPLPQPEISNE